MLWAVSGWGYAASEEVGDVVSGCLMVGFERSDQQEQLVGQHVEAESPAAVAAGAAHDVFEGGVAALGTRSPSPKFTRIASSAAICRGAGRGPGSCSHRPCKRQLPAAFPEGSGSEACSGNVTNPTRSVRRRGVAQRRTEPTDTRDHDCRQADSDIPGRRWTRHRLTRRLELPGCRARPRARPSPEAC